MAVSTVLSAGMHFGAVKAPYLETDDRYVHGLQPSSCFARCAYLRQKVQL